MANLHRLRDRDRRLPPHPPGDLHQTDELARDLAIARTDHRPPNLIDRLSTIDLLIIDDFLTVSIDPEAGNDLFAILANRNERLATIIASQTGPTWVDALPDRVAADSIVDRLAHHARRIELGGIDIKKGLPRPNTNIRTILGITFCTIDSGPAWQQPGRSRQQYPPHRIRVPTTQTTGTNRRYVSGAMRRARTYPSGCFGGFVQIR